MRSPSRKFYRSRGTENNPNDNSFESNPKHCNPCIPCFQLSRNAKISAFISLLILVAVIAVPIAIFNKKDEQQPISYNSGLYQSDTERFQNIYGHILDSISEVALGENPSIDVPKEANINENLSNNEQGGANANHIPPDEDVSMDPNQFKDNIGQSVTPQAEALNWIANYDEANLSSDHENMVIRYSLAAFFLRYKQ